jgi:predicted DNA-binding WGR domain protein
MLLVTFLIFPSADQAATASLNLLKEQQQKALEETRIAKQEVLSSKM